MSFAPSSSVSSFNGSCHAGANGPFVRAGQVSSGTRLLTTKPRPANINTSAAGYAQAFVENENRDGHAPELSSSVPSLQLNGMHLLNTPTSPSQWNSGNRHLSPPQTAPIKKPPSMIRSFFVCKATRSSSNSVAPFPKSPTSPTNEHFSYTSTTDPQNVDLNHPYSSDRSTLAAPSSYGSDSHPPSCCPSNDHDIGMTSNFPNSAISLTQITCDPDPSQLPSPISPPEHVQQSRSSPMRLGPHNLIIPPYKQLQKKREDLKRKDTSQLPQENVDAGHSAFPSKLGSSPTTCQNGNNKTNQEEKLTVSAKYLTNHTLNPEFNRRYVVGDELGSGGFGFVVSAKRISDGSEVAVKFIHKDKVPVHGWIHDARLGYIPMEIYVIKNFPHPGMISYVDMYDDFKFFYLIMELHGTPWTATPQQSPEPIIPVPGQRGGLVGAAAAAAATAAANSNLLAESEGRGAMTDHPAPKKKFKNPPRPGMARRTSCDLFECIEHHSKFSENKARHIFKQIVDCVKFLDDCGICHRDIKDENIVIDKNLKVKLIDFGSAVIIRPTGQLFDRFYGTINYASPEILRGEKYRAESAEIWSLGILLYTLLYGEVPFNDPQQAIYGPYVRPKMQSSRECVHLLNWMLEKKSSQRASIEEVFCHPWLHPAGDGKP